MNRALLSKLAWNLVCPGSSLPFKVLRAMYIRNGSFWQTSQRGSDSFIWRGILKARDIVSKGACFLVGDGTTIDVWKSPWIPEFNESGQLVAAVPDGFQEQVVDKVADLFIPGTRE